MTLKLYFHPLSSYSHKALIALYENAIAFEPRPVDDAQNAAELKALWPVMRFPLLRDDARDWTVPEASIIIEYLAQHYPGTIRLLPDDADRARQVRLRDRFFDNYLHAHVQKFAFDHVRPAGTHDAYGVEQAKQQYFVALDMVEKSLAGKSWAMGEDFTMADCAAAPPLFYGNRFFGPFRDSHPVTAAYLERLMARPSYARALREAEPYFHMLPK